MRAAARRRPPGRGPSRSSDSGPTEQLPAEGQTNPGWPHLPAPGHPRRSATKRVVVANWNLQLQPSTPFKVPQCTNWTVRDLA